MWRTIRTVGLAQRYHRDDSMDVLRCQLRAIFGQCMDKLMLDEQFCLLRTELTATDHTVETDFAVKIYLSAATFWAVEILILRLKHYRIGPFSSYKVLLITTDDILSAIFGPNKSWPVRPSPKTRIFPRTQTSILLDQHRKADLDRHSDLAKILYFLIF